MPSRTWRPLSVGKAASERAAESADRRRERRHTESPRTSRRCRRADRAPRPPWCRPNRRRPTDRRAPPRPSRHNPSTPAPHRRRSRSSSIVAGGRRASQRSWHDVGSHAVPWRALRRPGSSLRLHFPPSRMQLLLLLTAAFVAGVVNSIAGGGTLLTFPSLLALQLPSVAANATSTMALAPGSFSAFFGYGASQDLRRNLLWYAIPSLAGGITGALILVQGGERFFKPLVPWLILGATLLFALQGPLKRWAGTPSLPPAEHPGLRRRLGRAAIQFLIAIYGGFFGAGMGILMMATMGPSVSPTCMRPTS